MCIAAAAVADIAVLLPLLLVLPLSLLVVLLLAVLVIPFVTVSAIAMVVVAIVVIAVVSRVSTFCRAHGRFLLFLLRCDSRYINQILGSKSTRKWSRLHNKPHRI